MKIDRLLGITLALLNRKSVTARELADRFEVSPRTIYRDINELSVAGIPVVANKGNQGGISLLEDFVLNRSVLTEHERDSIVLALKTLQVTRYPEIASTLDKIGALFRDAGNTDWVQIEFSPWGSGTEEEHKFTDLRRAILECRVISFDYLNSTATSTQRAAEPVKLIFKSQAWYVLAYCRLRQEWRLFRVSRIRKLCVTKEGFVRRLPDAVFHEPLVSPLPLQLVTIKLRFQPREMFRVYDDFDEEMIDRNPDGTCDVSVTVPGDEWVYGYILSFGSYVEVLEPPDIRENVQKRLSNALKYYDKTPQI